MQTINFWVSLIFASVTTIFLGVLFDWGTLQIVLCFFISWTILNVMGSAQILEIEQEEENRELINKALRHYNETNGVK